MWLIHLSGTVSDAPVVRGTESGIPREGLRVTLVDADGEALGEVGQIATIAGDSAAGSTRWSLDYTVPDAEPDGCYTVKAEVVDNITAIPGLPEQQKALHTTAKSNGIVIDAPAPTGGARPVLARSWHWDRWRGTSLAGATTKRPVPVEVDMTTTTGADHTGVKLTCRHGNAGSWYTVFEMLPGQLSPTVGAALGRRDPQLGSTARST